MKNGGRICLVRLLLAGGLAAGLACLLAGLGREFYREQLAAQVWPDTGADWPAVGGVTNHFARTVLLVGDSRMAEWPARSLPGATRVVNAGIRRATTAQLLPVLPGLLARFRPDVVVIEAGINDLKYLGLEPGRAAEVVAHTFNNLTNLAELCREQHCAVVLLTVWPAGEPDWKRRLVWGPAIPSAVERVNEELRRLPAAPGFQVADFFAGAGIVPGPGTYRDTLHLRRETYGRMEAELAGVLADGKR